MQLNCLIIDDEPPAIKILESLIKKIPFLNLKGSFTNALEAIAPLSSQKIDLLFLDIQMPDITGIQFLRSLENPPMVIFTTAYDQYALEGYELEILDYLLKPIPFERFLKACNKALKHAQRLEPEQKEEPALFLKVEYKTVKVLLNQILYIEGLKDYVKVFTTEKTYLTRLNLKGIHAKLPTDKFVRVHRSYIAAISKISAFQKNLIKIGSKEIPVGSSYKENLMNILKG